MTRTPERGLTAEEARARARAGQANVVPSRSRNTVGAIIARNVFTYFNGIFALLAALVIWAGSYKQLTFMVVVVANTLIGIVQQLRAKRVIDALALLDVSEYDAIRDGERMRVASEELVLGDLVCLEAGQQVPADAEVVSGSAWVNEALITGEADEVERGLGEELKSGSFVVAGSLVACLTRVGAESYAARLTEQARELRERPSEMVRDIDRIIIVASVLIVPVGALLLWRAIMRGGMSFPEATTAMVGAVTGMIPEGLYLLVTIALALSAMRLARQQVLLHDMRSIEALARADVLCVDKTGTITQGDLVVRETFAPAGRADADLAEARELLARYVATMPDANATMVALRKHLPSASPLETLELLPFSSRRKYSEATLEGESLRLGAPELLLDAPSLACNALLIEERADVGMRVLALVRLRSGRTEPLLFIGMADAVRQNARETFAEFARQGVAIKVISGDNPRTVSSVAREAGIAGAERYVDATTLDTPERLAEAASSCTVFGRVRPEQKRQLVAALRSCGLKVAMTGDGVNDILAMKEADCSIAMGGGSAAARQAAQVVLLDSDFSHMRQIVSEGRRDVNNITRSATLFLYKNVFSLALALFSIVLTLSYPLTPNQVSLVSFTNIGLPALLLAFEPNDRKQEGRFIFQVLVRSLPAAVAAFCPIAFLMLAGPSLGITEAEVGTAGTFLLASAGYLLLLGIIWPLNRYRVVVLVLCAACLLVGCGPVGALFDIVALSAPAVAICAVLVAVQAALIWVVRRLVSR